MPSAPPTTRRICVRCQLRYCSQDCQQHYWRSGHQENCEIIHRGGDEQYHAEKKYKWAVSVAVEAYVGRLDKNSSATLDHLHEAVTTLEEMERIAWRVFGGAHPLALGIWRDRVRARIVLRARETPPTSPPRRTSPHFPPPGSA